MSILFSLFIVAVIALDKAIVSSDEECGENQIKDCDLDCIEPNCANRIKHPQYFCNLRPSAMLNSEVHCVRDGLDKCYCKTGFLRDQTSMECVAPSQCPELPYDITQMAGPDAPGQMGISVYNAVKRIIDKHEAAADNRWQNEAAEIRQDYTNADEILKEKYQKHKVWSDGNLATKIFDYYQRLETLENKNT